jgi:hypothetical protein
MPYYGSMSRKRLQEINDFLISKLSINEDTAKDVMKGICNIVKYNPEASTYTHEKGLTQMAWRAKKAEEFGVSKACIARGQYKKHT